MDQPVAAPVDEADIAALPLADGEGTAPVLIGPPPRWDAEQQERWEAKRLRLRDRFERTLAEDGDWQAAKGKLLDHALAKGEDAYRAEARWVVDLLIGWKEKLATQLEAHGGADQQNLARQIRSTTGLQRALYGFPAGTVPAPALDLSVRAVVSPSPMRRRARERRSARARAPAKADDGEPPPSGFGRAASTRPRLNERARDRAPLGRSA